MQIRLLSLSVRHNYAIFCRLFSFFCYLDLILIDFRLRLRIFQVQSKNQKLVLAVIIVYLQEIVTSRGRRKELAQAMMKSSDQQ